MKKGELKNVQNQIISANTHTFYGGVYFFLREYFSTALGNSLYSITLEII